MKEQLCKKIQTKEKELKLRQELFMDEVKNINQNLFEENAINELLAIKELKAEISALKWVLQIVNKDED